MGEEFDESEVTFAEVEEGTMQENHYAGFTRWQHDNLKTKSKMKSKKKKKKKEKKQSVPINIQENKSCNRYVESDLFEDDYEDQRIVPPHVILGRRVARKAAYSIYAGSGRMSKGRELNQVRDLIFRLRGFLETS